MRSLPMLMLALLLALGAGASTNPDGTTTVVKTEAEDDDDGPHFGILSGTVKAIGFVLALPFKIVGGLISIIF